MRILIIYDTEPTPTLQGEVLWEIVKPLWEIVMTGNPDKICRSALERAQHYIDTHLDHLLSLADIATHAGLSVSTLQRQFKAHHHQTVAHYIRARKLDRARKALFHKEMSIGEAAFQAGYNHTSNFVTAYKRAFGVTPGNETA